MVIRPLRREDLERIDEIYRQGHDESFSLPDMSNTLTSAVVVDDNDKVVGFGVVKVYAEAIMVLDPDQSKMNRIVEMDQLFSEAYRACEEVGLQQLHVFVQDPGLQRLLTKHYGFKVATGVALVKEL